MGEEARLALRVVEGRVESGAGKLLIRTSSSARQM